MLGLPHIFRTGLAITALAVSVFVARADVIDDYSALKNTLDEAGIDLQGERWTPELWSKMQAARENFSKSLTDPEALRLWQASLSDPGADPILAAIDLGTVEARLQHVAALQMLATLREGNIEAAREWRVVILLPRYASAVEGTLALQRMGGDMSHREAVEALLAREYVIWQITRAREKADHLARLVKDKRASATLLTARVTEIQELAKFPAALMNLATGGAPDSAVPSSQSAFDKVLATATAGSAAQESALNEWRLAVEAAYPNLLSEDDVTRRERIILKLVRLIPREYQSGVRDGEIVIPLEYREAKTFTIQCQQIITELMPVWRHTKSEALQKFGTQLFSSFDDLEKAINEKQSPREIERLSKASGSVLQNEFGLSLKRAGKASEVVDETALEIRALLGESLAAAQAGQWRKAESLRLDAYVNFDLEIESRTLPRDPTLALRAERAFLDGSGGNLGIKAALDSRAKPDVLSASYEKALEGLDECTALTKVGLSPTAAIFSAVIIIAREGLEAVVILAALLAGLRGAENAGIRRKIGAGAWLALGASLVLFFVSRTLLQGFVRYGETLEAVISVIAVLILLMVTNWVFHKYYWTGWNAQLRDLSKAAQRQQATRFESLALIGVGFMTIFREGFETTLFMQSLILEAGMKPVLIGLLIGGGLIAALGFAVFSIGARLPYRKMLVATGILVVFVLFTFAGSTVRLFQTVGWLPVHPITGLELPAWMGIWFGIYPTWEGLVIPFLSFAYVGGAWLWVKVSSRLAQQGELQQQRSDALHEVPESTEIKRESRIPSGV